MSLQNWLLIYTNGRFSLEEVPRSDTESTGLRTMVANDPLHCVVNGCGWWRNKKHRQIKKFKPTLNDKPA